jgi:hypothetical protein
MQKVEEDGSSDDNLYHCRLLDPEQMGHILLLQTQRQMSNKQEELVD